MVVATCGILLAILTVTGSEPPDPASTLSQIRDRVAANWDRIDAIAVEYDTWHYGKKSIDLRTQLVVSGKKRVCRSTHGQLAPEEDPQSWEQYLLDDEWNVYGPYGRVFEVSRQFAGPPYTDKLTGHMFFEATGWWPHGDPARPLVFADGREKFLCRVLDDPNYTVLAMRESIDGVSCHVVERAGWDRLWIDMTRGVLRKRECFAGRVDDLRVTVSLRDYREVAEGVWLPFEIEREHFGMDVHTVHSVSRYRVNAEVPDSLFQFEPPPGTLIYDRDADQLRQVPGGFEFFETLIGRAADQVRQPRVAAQPTSTSRMFLPAGAGFVLATIVANWRRGARQPNGPRSFS